MKLRNSAKEDVPVLCKWLEDKTVLRNFPMCDMREIEDAVRVWLSYGEVGASITATEGNEVVGSAILYIQSLEKLKHQCLFAIIVSPEHRGKGVGTEMMEALEIRAREKFNLKMLHLEVYEGNPAKKLYERLGYEEYGRHPKFLKENGEYIDKIMMKKEL